MFCQNCGKELDDSAKFCPNCGTKAGAAGGGSKKNNRWADEDASPAPAGAGYRDLYFTLLTFSPFIIGILMIVAVFAGPALLKDAEDPISCSIGLVYVFMLAFLIWCCCRDMAELRKTGINVNRSGAGLFILTAIFGILAVDSYLSSRKKAGAPGSSGRGMYWISALIIAPIVLLVCYTNPQLRQEIDERFDHSETFDASVYRDDRRDLMREKTERAAAELENFDIPESRKKEDDFFAYSEFKCSGVAGNLLEILMDEEITDEMTVKPLIKPELSYVVTVSSEKNIKRCDATLKVMYKRDETLALLQKGKSLDANTVAALGAEVGITVIESTDPSKRSSMRGLRQSARAYIEFGSMYYVTIAKSLADALQSKPDANGYVEAGRFNLHSYTVKQTDDDSGVVTEISGSDYSDYRQQGNVVLSQLMLLEGLARLETERDSGKSDGREKAAESGKSGTGGSDTGKNETGSAETGKDINSLGDREIVEAILNFDKLPGADKKERREFLQNLAYPFFHAFVKLETTDNLTELEYYRMLVSSMMEAMYKTSVASGTITSKAEKEFSDMKKKIAKMPDGELKEKRDKSLIYYRMRRTKPEFAEIDNEKGYEEHLDMVFGMDAEFVVKNPDIPYDGYLVPKPGFKFALGILDADVFDDDNSSRKEIMPDSVIFYVPCSGEIKKNWPQLIAKILEIIDVTNDDEYPVSLIEASVQKPDKDVCLISFGREH